MDDNVILEQRGGNMHLHIFISRSGVNITSINLTCLFFNPYQLLCFYCIFISIISIRSEQPEYIELPIMMRYHDINTAFGPVF
jgi:hypothetical protein